jgi:hypothetical protein
MLVVGMEYRVIVICGLASRRKRQHASTLSYARPPPLPSIKCALSSSLYMCTSIATCCVCLSLCLSCRVSQRNTYLEYVHIVMYIYSKHVSTPTQRQEPGPPSVFRIFVGRDFVSHSTDGPWPQYVKPHPQYDSVITISGWSSPFPNPALPRAACTQFFVIHTGVPT